MSSNLHEIAHQARMARAGRRSDPTGFRSLVLAVLLLAVFVVLAHLGPDVNP